MLPPALLVLVSGVHVFGTNRAAIGFAQRIEQLAQAHRFFAEKRVAGIEHDLLVGVRKAVKGGVQLRNVVAFSALEGIKVGPAGTHVAIGGNQLLNGSALSAHFGVCTTGHHDFGLALFSAFGKGIEDRHMRNVFGIGAICCGNVLECVEIFAPVVGDAAWIGEVVFIHLFDIGRIAAEKIGIALIGCVHRCR